MITLTEQPSRGQVTETATEPGPYVLARNFILRLTGFPIELMESFAAPVLAEESDQCLEARQNALARCQPLLLSGSVTRNLRRKLKGCLQFDGGAEALLFAKLAPDDNSSETVGKEIEGLNEALARELDHRRCA